MRVPINILVTCSKRKRYPVPSGLQLRNHPRSSVETGLASWMRALKQTRVDAHPARDLYSGDHWSVAKSLEGVAAEVGHRVQLWVCSAGYGLVGIEEPIKPYAATFALETGSGASDCVGSHLHSIARATAQQRWWRGLAQRTSRPRGQPASISELARCNPSAPLIVALSTSYFNALQLDLAAARKELSRPGLLTILTGNSHLRRDLESNIVVLDASLCSLVGGTLTSLNVRVLRLLLANLSHPRVSVKALRTLLGTLRTNRKDLIRAQGTAQTDEEVRAFINSLYRERVRQSYTAALRKLRASGRACEQSRFRRLFQRISKEKHA